ncbi:MAG TPA: IclR family transcriptional regulator [Baekduia sp.]|nr:IclR family transcriptional regulator [Baekduia sp.]
MTEPANAPEVPAYPIESVDNALKLLLMFREQSPLRVADVARSLDVAPSTAHRLLAMLQYHGFVTQDKVTRGYMAGGALTDIGLAAVRDFDVRAVSHPLLESVARELGETTHLAILDGGDALFVDAFEGTRAVRVGWRIGVRSPAYLTAAGKAMLAHLPTEAVKALYPSATLPGRAPSVVVDRDGLLDSLVEAADRGFFVDDGESEEDVSAIAVPILTPAGKPLAAMSAAIPRSRFDDAAVERAVSPLREAVAEVMRRM